MEKIVINPGNNTATKSSSYYKQMHIYTIIEIPNKIVSFPDSLKVPK